jgi:hypothetical protein
MAEGAGGKGQLLSGRIALRAKSGRTEDDKNQYYVIIVIIGL